MTLNIARVKPQDTEGGRISGAVEAELGGGNDSRNCPPKQYLEVVDIALNGDPIKKVAAPKAEGSAGNEHFISTLPPQTNEAIRVILDGREQMRDRYLDINHCLVQIPSFYIGVKAEQRRLSVESCYRWPDLKHMIAGNLSIWFSIETFAWHSDRCDARSGHFKTPVEIEGKLERNYASIMVAQEPAGTYAGKFQSKCTQRTY